MESISNEMNNDNVLNLHSITKFSRLAVVAWGFFRGWVVDPSGFPEDCELAPF